MPKRSSIPQPVSQEALLSRLPPLTEKERRLVSLKLLMMAHDGAPAMTDTAIARECGYHQPAANAARVFARPRVQQSIRQALEILGCDAQEVARKFREHLHATEWRRSLRAAEDIARLYGEFSPESHPSPSAVSLLSLSQSPADTLSEIIGEVQALLALAQDPLPPPPPVNPPEDATAGEGRDA